MGEGREERGEKRDGIDEYFYAFYSAGAFWCNHRLDVAKHDRVMNEKIFRSKLLSYAVSAFSSSLSILAP